MSTERRLGRVLVNRRSVLGMGIAVGAGWAAHGTGGSAGALDPRATRSELVDVIDTDSRYLFTCTFDRGVSRQFTSLQEVWATPDYMHITFCDVRYVGPGEHTLTLKESAIVYIAQGAGATPESRPALYLTILATCTRIHPAALDATLAQRGKPVVTAALELAPYAPQARHLAEWLARAS